MLESIGSLITAIKNAGPPIYAAVLLATLLLLFLPDPVISQLGLTEFKRLHQTEAGVALIASASLVAVHALSGVWFLMLSAWYKWRFRQETLKNLAELTEVEKEFMRPYMFNGTNTHYASISDGITKGLEAKKLIYRSSNVTHTFEWPYNLQPYVRRLLKRRLHFLK